MPIEGMAEGGEVGGPEVLSSIVEDISTPQTVMEFEEATTELADDNENLRAEIDRLMMARAQAEDQGEADYIDGLIKAVEVGSRAPMADMALELAQAGRGEDVSLAHLRPGEVILPPEMFDDDPEFESLIEQKFFDLDLDPEAYVVGSGIASLNPITGLEEFGWLKKTWKSVKKVAKKVIKPIAKIAQFIPGPWQPIAALVSKAYTVYDVAKGRANPLALATVFGPMATGGSITKNIADITDAGGGSFFAGVGELGMGTVDSVRAGVANIFSDPANALTQKLPDLLMDANYKGLSETERQAQATDLINKLSTDPNVSKTVTELAKQGITDPVEQVFALQRAGVAGAGNSLTNVLTGRTTAGTLLSGKGGKGIGGLLPGGGGQPGAAGSSGSSGILGGIAGALGLGAGAAGGGGGSNLLGTLGAAGIAGLLGKLAYEEAKNRKGVPLTPLTTMNAAGRYNIEAEVNRRMGLAPPNPTEFGLLPANTLPPMSGGREAPMPTETAPPTEEMEMTEMTTVPRELSPQEAVMSARTVYDGPVMAFAGGGDVDMEKFKRMDGKISGEGTEVSDDIPAMLSDGEFVMTGRAVRGAGAFDMKKQNGIISLVPSGKESREAGTKLMYEMMDLFSEYAEKPRATA